MIDIELFGAVLLIMNASSTHICNCTNGFVLEYTLGEPDDPSCSNDIVWYKLLEIFQECLILYFMKDFSYCSKTTASTEINGSFA